MNVSKTMKVMFPTTVGLIIVLIIVLIMVVDYKENVVYHPEYRFEISTIKPIDYMYTDSYEIKEKWVIFRNIKNRLMKIPTSNIRYIKDRK